tara:strand:- start:413 stop:763 length:351 start_codon:yes stop_codon:yes gene_type:complete
MGIFYALAAIATAFMAPPVYKAGVRNIAAWKLKDTSWQALVLSAASLLLIATALAWVYLVFITLGSWYASFDASSPKPAFILLWLIGAFVYGFGINFSDSLNSLALREYEKDSFWS